MPSGGIEPATPAIKWLQNYNLDRKVTGDWRCPTQRKHTAINKQLYDIMSYTEKFLCTAADILNSMAVMHNKYLQIFCS